MNNIKLIEIDFEGEMAQPTLCSLKHLPRIGEKIKLKRPGYEESSVFEVIDIHHTNAQDQSGDIEVFAHFVGSFNNVVKALARKID